MFSVLANEKREATTCYSDSLPLRLTFEVVVPLCLYSMNQLQASSSLLIADATPLAHWYALQERSNVTSM